MSSSTCENCASVNELKAELAEVKADIKLIIRLLLSARATNDCFGAYSCAADSEVASRVLNGYHHHQHEDAEEHSELGIGEDGLQFDPGEEHSSALEKVDTSGVGESPLSSMRDTLAKAEFGDNDSSRTSQDQGESPVGVDDDPNLVREQQDSLQRTLDAFNYTVAAAAIGNSRALQRHLKSLTSLQDKGLNLNNNNISMDMDPDQLAIAEFAAEQAASFSQFGASHHHSRGGSNSASASVKSESGNEEAIYDCTMCEQSFTSRYRLRIHEKFHSAGLPFACSVCGMSFEQYRYLKFHQKSHIDVRTQMCDVCGVSFASNGQLKRHLAVHFGEKRHMCSYCQKFFSRADNRNTHELRCQLKHPKADHHQFQLLQHDQQHHQLEEEPDPAFMQSE